mmetsp:Transcript_2624/g.3732  ORF Transcript_2624/g.3732 Transcript_2624/m.3732 type:complete len:90 (+) Transcript_2624:493-762(+)
MSHTRDSTRLFESLRLHATHCNTLQHSVTLCNTLQLSATLCNSLQLSAPHCNTLQHLVLMPHTYRQRMYVTLPTPCFSAENRQRQGVGG